MDSPRSSGPQSPPVMAGQLWINNDLSLNRTTSKLSAYPLLPVKGNDLTCLRGPVAWVSVPPSFRSLCLSLFALSPGCPQPHTSSIISATWPQSQDSLIWVALCLPILLPKRNLIIGIANLLCIYCIYWTAWIHVYTRLYLWLLSHMFHLHYHTSCPYYSTKSSSAVEW